MNHYYTNSDLDSQKKEIFFNIQDTTFTFFTDNGVFSKNRVDFGSELLIKTLLEEELRGIGLDYGCGYGPIGIVLSKFKGVPISMVDVNDRALGLARENSELNHSDNEIFDSDDDSFLDKEYDFVITNPPIRAGKKVVQSIFLNANAILKEGGVLYILIQKKQGLVSAKKFLTDHFREIQTIERKAGFHILKVIK